MHADTLTIDGNAITVVAGTTLADGLLTAGTDVVGCQDIIAALSATNAALVPLVYASDGGDIVIDGDFTTSGSSITSVKVVAIVDGSSTLSVDAAL